MLSSKVKARIAKNRSRRIGNRDRNHREMTRLIGASSWRSSNAFAEAILKGPRYGGQPSNAFLSDIHIAKFLKMVDEAPSADFIETQRLLSTGILQGGIKRGALFAIRAHNPNMYKTHFTHRLYEQMREASKDYKLDGILSEELLGQKIKFHPVTTAGAAELADTMMNFDPKSPWVVLDSFAEGLSAGGKDDPPKV
jgi:hypothetical protein